MSAKADCARPAKWSKSLINEGFRELKWTWPLCSMNIEAVLRRRDGDSNVRY